MTEGAPKLLIFHWISLPCVSASALEVFAIKAKQELSKGLRSSKSLADKVRRELEIDLKHSLSLVTLGYPREMAQFYSDAFQEVSTQAAELLETWTDYAKADTTAKSTTELEDMTSMLKEKHDLVEKGVNHIDPKRKQLYNRVGTEKPKKYSMQAPDWSDGGDGKPVSVGED